MSRHDGVSAAVLAGGRSSRLGFDKARLRLGTGRELIDDLIRKLRSVADDVMIVGGDPRVHAEREARLVPDQYPDTGPLGGICTAIEAASGEWTLVVSCDLPFLRTSILRLLLGARGGVDAVVPTVGGRPEPTHALYSRRCLGPARERVDAGQLKITGFFAAVAVRLVEEPELRRVDPNLTSFVDVDTPVQLAAAVARARACGTLILRA